MWYPVHMLTIVLTGGLGAGKSTAASFFRDHGATVLNLDDIAHAVLTPGSGALASIVSEFGEGVLAVDGSLDRQALAGVAFASPEAAATLNAIVHPAVAREVGPALRELDMLPMKPQVVVLEVPLLAEAPVFRELADQVLAIEAPAEVRIERVVSRGMDRGDAAARLRCQATDAMRAELADDVIVNAGTVEEFVALLESYWDSSVAPIASNG